MQVFTGAKLMKRANYAGFEIKFYTALPRIVEVGHVTWHLKNRRFHAFLSLLIAEHRSDAAVSRLDELCVLSNTVLSIPVRSQNCAILFNKLVWQLG